MSFYGDSGVSGQTGIRAQILLGCGDRVSADRIGRFRPDVFSKRLFRRPGGSVDARPHARSSDEPVGGAVHHSNLPDLVKEDQDTPETWVVFSGVATAIAAAKRGGGNAAPPDIPPLSFLAVPLFDMVVFALLFGAAVYFRKQAANHKRLMLLTVLNFLPPAVARIPLSFVTAGGPLVFFGVPDVLAIVFVIADTWRNKKLNRVFLAGAILLIASHPLRIIISMTDAWVRFAEWLTSF
jgi:hypothetical protein